jgi:hypothetical protein
MKNLLLVTLLVFLAGGLSACKDSQNAEPTGAEQQSIGAPRNEAVTKPVAGNEQTEHYADKPATIKHGTTTDPYTGTSDRVNYAGKNEPIAPQQVPVEKVNH